MIDNEDRIRAFLHLQLQTEWLFHCMYKRGARPSVHWDRRRQALLRRRAAQSRELTRRFGKKYRVPLWAGKRARRRVFSQPIFTLLFDVNTLASDLTAAYIEFIRRLEPSELQTPR